MKAAKISIPVLLAMIFLAAAAAWAGITGSISGVVTDPSGGVIAGATVTATDTLTGVKTVVQTNGKGFYEFPTLPVGAYEVEIQQSGFKKFKQSGIVIDANSNLRVDAKLELGTASEEVVVTGNAVRVETQSTQLGEVIGTSRIQSVPLNGRAFTDLLALQVGVSPYNADSSGTNSVSSTGTPGIGDRKPSGGQNEGNQSINGQRETANGYMVNGASVEEGKNNGASVIPNLDSLEEFRIITNNFDAEYGNYSGGQINVVTKSGTNQIHGSAFDFLRNTALDARNFFDTSGKTPVFIQNQFGGTLGAPIKKDKLFVFLDYQGSRQVQAPTDTVTAPSAADLTGNVTDLGAADALAPLQTVNNNLVNVPATVNGTFWAQQLATATGNGSIVSGFPYYFLATDFNPNTNAPYGVSCTMPSQCVFPNAVIPAGAISPVATNIIKMKVIPTPTPGAPNNQFTTSAFSKRLKDDKGAVRIDDNTRFGTISGYYFIDDSTLDDPYPNGGATVPGFAALSIERAQLFTLGVTKPFGATAVNEFRFGFVRDAANLFKPKGGLGVTLSSLGFVTPFSAPGGTGPIDPSFEGVPSIVFNNFTIGVPSTTPSQFNNSFQWLDNFTKIIGTHSLKFGGQYHYDQINLRNFFGENGDFSFSGTETGSDIVDFLIGAPSSFIQASHQILDSRTKYMGLFVQDSWRARSNLTFNYGLRWEFSEPFYDTQGKIETIIPGEQSLLFPGAPLGWVVPGDPGVPKTLSPTRYNNFSPRLGLAYTPGAQSGFLAKLTGGPDKTSIRLGFGIFYTAVEDQSQFLEIADAPFGLFWVSPVPSLLNAPFIDRATGNNEGQKFPFVFPPGNVSAKNPDTTFNWANVEPISSGFVSFPKNRLPYAEHYDLSIQRQITSGTVATFSFVGTQAHRLPTSLEANPSIPALCLSVSTPSQVAPGTATCGPNGETGAFTTAGGQTVIPRAALGVNFGSNPYEDNMANSAYNSFQASLHHSSKNGSMLAGYTRGKCLDNSSGLQDGTNPFNYRASRSLCNFDVAQYFVASYTVRLPLDAFSGAKYGWANRLTRGWSVAGITSYATGLPITLSDNSDNSLIGATTQPIDVPNVISSRVLLNTNPRNQSGGPYINPKAFLPETLGQLGNANRRFFHGPGINNWDISLMKDTQLTETKSIEFKMDAFNIFNHAQFANPSGEINGSFGVVTSARDPRVLQAALKFKF